MEVIWKSRILLFVLTGRRRRSGENWCCGGMGTLLLARQVWTGWDTPMLMMCLGSVSSRVAEFCSSSLVSKLYFSVPEHTTETGNVAALALGTAGPRGQNSQTTVDLWVLTWECCRERENATVSSLRLNSLHHVHQILDGYEREDSGNGKKEWTCPKSKIRLVRSFVRSHLS